MIGGIIKDMHDRARSQEEIYGAPKYNGINGWTLSYMKYAGRFSNEYVPQMEQYISATDYRSKLNAIGESLAPYSRQFNAYVEASSNRPCCMICPCVGFPHMSHLKSLISEMNATQFQAERNANNVCMGINAADSVFNWSVSSVYRSDDEGRQVFSHFQLLITIKQAGGIGIPVASIMVENPVYSEAVPMKMEDR